MKPRKLRKPRVEFYQDADGDWRWRMRASNGRIMACSSEGYRRRPACESAAKHAGITIMRVLLPDWLR